MRIAEGHRWATRRAGIILATEGQVLATEVQALKETMATMMIMAVARTMAEARTMTDALIARVRADGTRGNAFLASTGTGST